MSGFYLSFHALRSEVINFLSEINESRPVEIVKLVSRPFGVTPISLVDLSAEVGYTQIVLSRNRIDCSMTNGREFVEGNPHVFCMDFCSIVGNMLPKGLMSCRDVPENIWSDWRILRERFKKVAAFRAVVKNMPNGPVANAAAHRITPGAIRFVEGGGLLTVGCHPDPPGRIYLPAL